MRSASCRNLRSLRVQRGFANMYRLVLSRPMFFTWCLYLESLCIHRLDSGATFCLTRASRLVVVASHAADEMLHVLNAARKQGPANFVFWISALVPETRPLTSLRCSRTQRCAVLISLTPFCERCDGVARRHMHLKAPWRTLVFETKHSILFTTWGE